MTERSRSALYQGLSTVVDEEAVQEMMSFFPARDVEEPVTKEFLRAEMADLRAQMAELRAEMAELRAEMADLRTELRAEMAALELRLNDRIDAKFNRVIGANIASVVTIAAVILAAVRL
jgi:chromosome segregation ATPase